MGQNKFTSEKGLLKVKTTFRNVLETMKETRNTQSRSWFFADKLRKAQDEHTKSYIFEISIKIRISGIKHDYFLTTLKNFLNQAPVVGKMPKVINFLLSKINEIFFGDHSY